MLSRLAGTPVGSIATSISRRPTTACFSNTTAYLGDSALVALRFLTHTIQTRVVCQS